ncbi:hypothetical protein GGX14DRAFT_670785 [Mycena pura]|uniref:Uncharacterized protein n=1 Tax=Mycena pura TaxID=153505 RepID=A0AAD6VSW7_9AGAR|nr:hypothetical protein GGX14DRAFT_670785 [Mycena pura]
MSLLSPSILLPSQPSTNSLSSAASASSTVSTSSSSASSSDSSHTSAASHASTPTMDKPIPSARRIRFAPLPDPRRSVLLAPDGTELPLLVRPEDPELPVTHAPTPSQSLRPSPSPAASPSASPATAPALLPSSPPSSFYPPPRSTSPWSRPKNFLRFRRGAGTPASSTDSLTPTPSVDASEPASGAALQRWSSNGSAAVGSPLARTQSQTSTTSSKQRARSIFSLGKDSGDKGKNKSRSSSPALNPFANSLGSKRGTRMLNGRVYGSRNPDGTHNPFGNARDEDPKFVEWGYGGMGSVRNGSSAWQRVQGGGGSAGKADGNTNGKDHGNVHIGMGVVGDGDDGDDGSGMGWVRKRREAREREARERAEREAREKDAQEKPGSDHIVGSPATSHPASHPASPIGTPLLPHSPPSSASLHTEEHVLRAVNVPAGFRGHHYHHRSNSNALSAGYGLPGVIAGTDGVAAMAAGERRSSVSSESESDSESDSDLEDEDEDIREKSGTHDEARDDEEEEDEEDEEDEKEEKARATALSAGVEKISRHKE